MGLSKICKLNQRGADPLYQFLRERLKDGSLCEDNLNVIIASSEEANSKEINLYPISVKLLLLSQEVCNATEHFDLGERVL
ncbi:hypothetical protein IEQ34_005935 [Dendrobium chrysotoxum]|uniref:Uncharacterized protein n=1 Tax=Dendrobium chrysotoxum TaxID=161865 RepID=A0AAV7HBH9_DENCH|nr:hypothetical protein IEQ34_005935 [Dendrobium chrysotoxum]